MSGAVAVDLGAGSGRIVIGRLEEGRIAMQMVRQVAHEPEQRDGHLRWRFPFLLDFCREAVSVAEAEGASSVGIDSWGVDHGFLDRNGELLGAPICYRDLSHVDAFESLAPHRRRLYELTGTQHQPFNTICQFVARVRENPSILKEAADWMILPDLLGYILTGQRRHEVTQASTTQLLGWDGSWSQEAFAIAGWPVPERSPTNPGGVQGALSSGVQLISVGSHDTSSAVAGFGKLGSSDLFLNVGTWSLCGVVLDKPLVTESAETLGFTNERTVDGKIRFLKNIPGFYFINRLHAELGVTCSVPDWLQMASKTSAQGSETINLLLPEFFNPESMVETCASRLAKPPDGLAAWAAIALDSMVEAVAETSREISTLTGCSFTSIRVGGGGSQSEGLCQRLSDRMGMPVWAGPAEATVLGNLAVQFLGQGKFANWTELFDAVGRSLGHAEYLPKDR